MTRRSVEQPANPNEMVGGDAQPNPASRPDRLRVAIVVGSTRPGRNAVAVADWVHTVASRRDDAIYEVVDIADYALPLLDEPMPPITGEYTQPHTRQWAAAVGSFDAFVFVTPEYNHSMPAALKNALDYLYAEWNDKAAGFVSYGADGGIRAAEQLRLVMGELKIADVRQPVTLTLTDDFENYTTFAPSDGREPALTTMLDELTAWGTALRTLRNPAPSPTGRDQTLEWILIRYRVEPDQLDRHLELLHAVYDQLHATQPDGLHYATFQLDDEHSFVDIAASPTLPGPLPELETFRRYRADLDQRCDERIASELHPVVAYRFH